MRRKRRLAGDPEGDDLCDETLEPARVRRNAVPASEGSRGPSGAKFCTAATSADRQICARRLTSHLSSPD